MNIDLLRTGTGEFGLVCDKPFEQTPQAVLFDMNLGTLSVEFASDRDALVCNIPVVEEWRQPLAFKEYVLIGSVADSVVQSADRVALKALI